MSDKKVKMKAILFLTTIVLGFSNLEAQINFEFLTNGRMNLGSGDGAGLLHLGANSTINFPTLRLTEDGQDFARLTFENDQTPDKYWSLAGRQRADDKDSRFYFYYRKDVSSGSNLMSLTGEGRLGINRSNPAAHIDVNGAIKMSMNVAPDAEGMIRYNSAYKNFEGYNGMEWRSLTEPVPTPPSYEIGDYEDEGVVFWISPDSSIVKFVYIGSLGSHLWSNPWSIDANGAESNFDGEKNTDEISLDPSLLSSAAKVCRDFVAGGHSDWYLPAINELGELEEVKEIVNATIATYLGDSLWSAGGTNTPWSSTEASTTEAFYVAANGVINDIGKNANLPVRAIRTVTFD